MEEIYGPREIYAQIIVETLYCQSNPNKVNPTWHGLLAHDNGIGGSSWVAAKRQT